MERFCGKCGAQLHKQTGLCPVCDGAPENKEKPMDITPPERPVPPVGQKRTARFCGRCGGPTNPQTGYCPVCGIASRYAAEEDVIRTPPEFVDKTPPDLTGGKPPKKKRRAGLWIVLGVVVLLVVAAVAVGMLEHFRIVSIPAVRKLEESMGITPYAAEAIYDDDGVLQGYEVRKDNDDYLRYDAKGALEYYELNERNADGQLQPRNARLRPEKRKERVREKRRVLEHK